MAEEMEDRNSRRLTQMNTDKSFSLRRSELTVVLFAALIYLTSAISPPRFMDDVDAVQAQIARNMLDSGDWVTARLDGVAYLEKSPLVYWAMATSFKIFGVHDWAARLPIALSAIVLCWMVARMAGWAMGARASLFAGLALATSLGMWLFTRILIPDVILTLAIAVALWCLLRALEEDEKHWRRWSLGAWAAIGTGILLKGLIAMVFPFGTALLYLIVSGLWRRGETWRRLSILPGVAVMLLIAAPWHVLATLRNPPYFDFTMHSESGSYRGFFWFYFFNEHILRFLNLRYPRDYDTVPPVLFWVLHLAWFFPWSAFFFRAVTLQFRGEDRASRLRLLCVCWIAMVMGFFLLSTTQEYYSMPAYPAYVILIGSAMAAAGEKAWKWCLGGAGVITAAAFVAILGILWASRSYDAPGDIAQALSHNPGAYTLSLGHMGDLTLRSFAYLRWPLAIAALATLVGAIGAFALRGQRAAIAVSVMLVLFYQAARQALVAFDPYLGSYSLAEAINRAPRGGLIVDNPYYEFSSIFFYTNHEALILNGRVNNLEYGSYAPGAKRVFIGDEEFVARWRSPLRWYLASEDEKLPHIRDLVGMESLHAIAHAGGKTIYVNQ
jgi:4-amino-4-deoxy-L-arabinose transferase-like glycosyltransferase